MDVISTYSILQYHRDLLTVPYFTLQQFVQALSLETPAARFLMTQICHQLLHKLNNKPQQFSNSCNVALNYYNNSTSRAKQLQYLQRFEYFVELSQSGKIEMLRQIILGILGQQCAHYDGAGKFTSGLATDAEAFSQQGIDIHCNEYYIYYPNILVIYSLNQELDVVKSMGLQEQCADNIFADMIGSASEATNVFNAYLTEQQFMAQIVDNQGNVMDPKQVERFYEAFSESQKSRVHLYGFNSQAIEEPAAQDPNNMSEYKTGSFDVSAEVLEEYYEQLQFGIDRLLFILQTEKLETVQKYIDDPDRLFKYMKQTQKSKDTDGAYEDIEEYEEDEMTPEKPKHLTHQQIDQIKLLLSEQKERYKAFLKSDDPMCQLPSENKLSFAIKLQQTETPLQLIAMPNFVRFSQISSPIKPDMVHTHIINISKKEYLWKILDYVQFMTLKYLRTVLLGQKPFQLQNKSIQITAKTFQSHRDLIVMQADHCYAILHGISANIAQYQQQQQESLESFKIENIKVYNDLSEQKNNFILNFCEIGDKNATVAFRRQKIAEVGIPERLQAFPIYLRSRNGFPKADELSFLKIELGYEKPVIEVIEPQAELESESSSSSSVQGRRRRGHEFTDDEYESYDDYYSLITSDEQMSPISSTTSEPEDEEESTTPEPIHVEKLIKRKDFNFDTMEAIDANGNVIIQPRRPSEVQNDQENGVKDELTHIFGTHGSQDYEKSDPERQMLVRVWREPELLEKERRKRERARKRAEAIKNKTKKQQTKQHQHRGRRKKTIIINSDHAQQFKQFDDVLRQQKLQTEALKRLAMEQMQGKKQGVTSRPNARLSVAKLITPQHRSAKSGTQYFGEPNTNIMLSGFQNNNLSKSMGDTMVMNKQNTNLNLSSSMISSQAGMQSQFMYQAQQSKRPDLKMSELKKKLRQYESRSDIDDNLRDLNSTLDMIIRSQEAKAQKGRLPLSFYDDIIQKMMQYGYTVDEYMK